MTPDKGVSLFTVQLLEGQPGPLVMDVAVRDHLMADVHPHHLLHLQAQLPDSDGRRGLSCPTSEVQKPLLSPPRVDLQELSDGRHVDVVLGQV